MIYKFTDLSEEQIIATLTCVLHLRFLISMIIPARQDTMAYNQTGHRRAQSLTEPLFSTKKEENTTIKCDLEPPYASCFVF